MSKEILSLVVANLGVYNAGYEKSVKLWLPMEEEKLKEQLKSIGGMEHDTIILDYEFLNNWQDFEIGEYESLIRLNQFLQYLSVKDDCDIKCILALFEHLESSYKEAIAAFESGMYIHLWDVYSEEELGNYLLDVDTFGQFEEELRYYIDCEKLGEEWAINHAGTFTEYGYVETKK